MRLAVTIGLLAGAVSAFSQTGDRFEVAAVRLNNSGSMSMKFPVPAGGRFSVTNIPLKTLIAFAYNLQNFQIFGAPGWTNTERFDVDARATRIELSRAEYQAMLRGLLEERFRLRTHAAIKDLPSYELAGAKPGGVRLKEADPHRCDPISNSAVIAGQLTGVTCGTFFTGDGALDGRSMTMPGFTNALAIVLGRPVRDRTGITGAYDIHLEFDPEGVNLGNGPAALSTEADRPANSRPSIFSAVQQQLGLKLQSHKEPTNVLVIDQMERLPTEN